MHLRIRIQFMFRLPHPLEFGMKSFFCFLANLKHFYWQILPNSVGQNDAVCCCQQTNKKREQKYGQFEINTWKHPWN